MSVAVADDGIGIPADLLPRIFDIFTQGSGTDGPVPAGLGIGLSVVRRLVAMHGGQVEARSDGQGAGSSFIVRLPVAADPEPGPSGRLVAAAVAPLLAPNPA